MSRSRTPGLLPSIACAPAIRAPIWCCSTSICPICTAWTFSPPSSRTPPAAGFPRLFSLASLNRQEVIEAYNRNANSYIAKPSSLDEYIRVVKGVEEFWLTVVKLPRGLDRPMMADENIHVLLVEDNQEHANLLQRMLVESDDPVFTVLRSQLCVRGSICGTARLQLFCSIYTCPTAKGWGPSSACRSVRRMWRSSF